MIGGVEPPVLRLALPLRSETHWSDLLAVLIDTDPLPLSAVLGCRFGPEALSVSRESRIDPENQPDIVLTADGRRIAVIEVKVLAGLGRSQLEKYYAAVPDADVYALIYPERLAIPLHDGGPWRELTWERLLLAYEDSSHPWVAATARGWRHHLDSSLPKVGPETRWNDLHQGEDFVIAMRARMSWLHGQVHAPEGVEHDLSGSSKGRSWVLRLWAETPSPGYLIMIEAEEYLETANTLSATLLTEFSLWGHP